MKQKLLLKSMLLLFALIAGSSSVWADTKYKLTQVTSVSAGNKYVFVRNSYALDNNVSSSKLKTTNSYSTTGLTGTESYVWTLETAEGGFYLKNVSLASNQYVNNTSSGNISFGSKTSVWSISFDNNVALISNTSNFNRFIGETVSGSHEYKTYASSNLANYGHDFTVYVLEEESGSTPTCATPTFSPTPGVYTSAQNVTINCETGSSTIYYTIDGSTPTTSSSVYSGAISVSTTTTIKAIAVKAGNNNSSVASGTYAILGHAGTEVDPYTVADARNAIDAGTGLTGAYVQGRISKIDEVNLADGKKWATYWISADGLASGDQLEAYRGKFTGNTDFTSEDQIGLFDQVVITGNLTKYSSTYEFSAGNYIYSLTPDTRIEAGLAWTKDAIQIEKDAASYSLPSLTNPHSLAVAYTITGTAGLVSESAGVITVDTSIEGTATVTANYAGDATYRPASISFTITVVKIYSVADVINGTASGEGVYVKGFIVGEFPSSGTSVTTSSFTTDANVALADEYNTTTAKASAIPVQLNTDALKSAWGNKTNKGTTMGYQVLVKGKIDSYFSVNGIKPASEVSAISFTIIPAKEYTTLIRSKALDFTSVSSNLKAYIATTISDSKVQMTQVNKVPANTGLVLVKTSGTTFNVPVFDGTGADDVTGNLMAGSATTTTTVAANAGYILKDGAFHPSSGANALPAGKAYLNIAVSAPTLNLDFGGETTGINAVNGSEFKVNGEYYNLAGQRVAQPTKGLYIVNGKKVIIK